ncbi:MAG: TolC family protein [Treponema sp.]|nr:TolC family protein [Treponema sp.]MCL2250620.1 TolC family protein [Treponema sp.]
MRNKLFYFYLFMMVSCTLYAINQENNNQTLTFAQAAELAVTASVDLKHSRSSQILMEGAWRWGIREFFPKIGISISENDRLQQLGADSFVKNYGISLEQLVFDGGRTSMSRKLEKLELDLSSSRLDRMALEISESAIAAYRNVLSSRAILEIKKLALNILEDQKSILKEEVQLGLALPVDLANAEINLLDAKLDIYLLELDLTEMEKQFAEILGLDVLPVLSEKVDINRPSVIPILQKSYFSAIADFALLEQRAKEQNPDLVEARFSITKRKAELKYASNSWIPTLRLTGNFGLSGQRYPLTRYNWSVGISIDINSPWIQNRFGVQASWEPPYDRTAMLQNSFTPLPDPVSRYGTEQARLALALEQEKYNTTLEQIGRISSNALEKCNLAEQKRLLALESIILGKERCRIEETRLELGQITRLDLMEVLIEQTQREINAIQTATALLEAERELEKFLDLKPGELSLFFNHQRRN